MAIKVPGETHSNQTAELLAVLVALQNVEPYVPITFMTDSKYVINSLTKHLPEWEDIGWIGILNSAHLRATAYQLRKRSAQTGFVWVKGHSGLNGNDQADTLAKEGANKTTDDHINLQIPNEFNLQGAKLSAITQALAYKGIMGKKTKPIRRATTNNLEIIRYAIQSITGHLETDANIWQGCRNKDIPRNIQQFIFKAIHGAHRIGEYWTNIPNFENRARCAHCNEDTENLKHILLECPDNAQTIVWNLARKLWPSKHGQWPQLTLGIILGCGNINLPNNRNNNAHNPPNQQAHRDQQQINLNKGTSRLLRILISESAHLIWALRCDTTINGTRHTQQSIITRWTSTINKRLQCDRLTAKKIIRTKSFENIVYTTWSDTLKTNDPTPKNWVTALEVLVGITLPRPSTNEATR
ncbi:RnaseH-domain-containing protein [Suillus tomentosus]|nr:RnaseH-domain-containing protein [Suillus tomentosus]